MSNQKKRAIEKAYARVSEHSHRAPHPTMAVQVWADIDKGIAELVRYLNTLPGVRTDASCQGTLGEGGPAPYRAYVMASWPAELEAQLAAEFDLEFLGEHWGYVQPREGWKHAPLSQPSECSKCGKPKFGAWSTICSADIGKTQEMYCACGETFNGQARAPLSQQEEK